MFAIFVNGFQVIITSGFLVKPNVYFSLLFTTHCIMQRFLPSHLRKKLLITATNFTIITKPVKLNALPTVNELLTITAKLERVKNMRKKFSLSFT